MRWRRTGRRKVGRKSGQNGLSCAIFSAYSTRINAGIAQLVEQLICNQQVVGSNPTAGSIGKLGFAHRLQQCLAVSWRLCLTVSCAVRSFLKKARIGLS